MSTSFKQTIKFFIIMWKIIGLLNFCCTMETESGLMHRDMSSTYNLYLEMIRIFVYLICSYHMVFNMGEKYLIVNFNILKYWCIIIPARMSEKRIIKLINGIIEFDRKLFLFHSLLVVELPTSTKTFWIAFVAIFSIYFIGCQLYLIHNRIILNLENVHFVSLLFHSPDIIIFIVMATSYFLLINLGQKYCILNRLWKLLPPGIVALPSGWSTSEITVLVECIRLLHTELSGLLRLFSLGYGPVILIYFTFTFIQALVEVFLIIVFNNSSVKLGILSFVFYIQYIMSTTSILYIASWVIKKKKKIISYLRLARISELPTETKIQVKIFMNQISAYEPNELTAYGFFNLNLSLFMSILVLMITGIATLIQMKEYSFMIRLNNLMTPQFTNLEEKK